MRHCHPFLAAEVASADTFGTERRRCFERRRGLGSRKLILLHSEPLERGTLKPGGEEVPVVALPIGPWVQACLEVELLLLMTPLLAPPRS